MGIETVNSVVWIGLLIRCHLKEEPEEGREGAIQYLQDDGPSGASRKDGSWSDR